MAGRRPESTGSIIPHERIERVIYLIRGHKVMLSFDLARLYRVEVRSLVQAVKRNAGRFPRDFMFQLTREEFNRLKSQFVILEQSPAPLLMRLLNRGLRCYHTEAEAAPKS